MTYFSDSQTQLVLLASQAVRVPGRFRNMNADYGLYDHFLARLQRLRAAHSHDRLAVVGTPFKASHDGRLYLEDVAIPASALTPDGRHLLGIDKDCWHVLALDKAGEVSCCLRYLPEDRAARLRDLYLPHRLRPVDILLQLALQSI